VNPLVPVNVDITTSMVAVVTVLTVMVVGLGTLARPSRATVAWGGAFGLGMLGAYLWLAGQQTDVAMLRGAASALLLCFEPLVWIGLRMHFGRRARRWPIVLFVLASPTLLVATAGTGWYMPAFQLVFLGSAVFAGLVAYELLRDGSAVRDIVLPLALASCGFVVVALVSAAIALISGGAGTEAQLSALRGLNAVGTVVVSTCAAFTLVLLVRSEQKKDAAGDIAERARRRLRKAEAQSDQPWSILDIRLDDPADLREASTGAAFALIVDRFHQDIEETLPASADADRVADGRAMVIIRGSDESVRHHLREILTRISVIDTETAVMGIRSSASIGWATASVFGYDYDALVTAAGSAADRARAAGGDQWKRATVADLASA
jgi:GGDEF domain-containing protein